MNKPTETNIPLTEAFHVFVRETGADYIAAAVYMPEAKYVSERQIAEAVAEYSMDQYEQLNDI